MKTGYKKFFRLLEVLIMVGLIWTVYGYKKENYSLFEQYTKLKTGSDYVINYQSEQILKLRYENNELSAKTDKSSFKSSAKIFNNENESYSINKDVKEKTNQNDILLASR